jgi:hypothetical protein
MKTSTFFRMFTLISGLFISGSLVAQTIQPPDTSKKEITKERVAKSDTVNNPSPPLKSEPVPNAEIFIEQNTPPLKSALPQNSPKKEELKDIKKEEPKK